MELRVVTRAPPPICRDEVRGQARHAIVWGTRQEEMTERRGTHREEDPRRNELTDTARLGIRDEGAGDERVPDCCDPLDAEAVADSSGGEVQRECGELVGEEQAPP